MKSASFQKKTIRVATYTLPFVLCSISFGEHAEYFAEDLYEGYTEIPASRVDEYYDSSTHQKSELSFEDWFNGPFAMRTSFGLRTDMENNGILPVITYLGNLAGNPTGGRRQGVTNTSSINLGLGLDLEKLTDIRELSGWVISNTWVWRFGESLTKNYLDNQFNVQQNYGNQSIRMQSLYALWYGRLGTSDFSATLKFGRFAAGENFITKPIYWMYQNNAIDGTPVGVFNQIKWTAYPGGVWAAFAELAHDNGGYLKGGVYQISSPKQESTAEHGLDWSIGGSEGVNANFEFGWNINHDESKKSPGNISAGIASDWYSADYVDNSGRTGTFNCSIYIQADYMVWNLGLPPRDSPRYFTRSPSSAYRDLRGLIVWGVVQYDPYNELAEMPFFATCGLLFNAPFASRPDDAVCLGIAYGRYSNDIPQPQKSSYEVMMELNYKIQVNRFLFFQPNVQYIVNPKGGKYSDALVLGMQFGASF